MLYMHRAQCLSLSPSSFLALRAKEVGHGYIKGEGFTLLHFYIFNWLYKVHTYWNLRANVRRAALPLSFFTSPMALLAFLLPLAWSPCQSIIKP